ncbi:MAG: hypothetical protein JSU72_02665 [Deltaproteobacteria bacterium]|nr:MAG: hypothetical protein JSU72_02665 [Deltaproteobacteria bacterium]
MPKEHLKRISFERFVEAMQVFSNDYEIVAHPWLEIRTCWEEPNEAGVYSLTQIPAVMNEGEFLEKMQPITNIAVTCMDKDCAHSTWERIEAEPEQIMMLTWGGGVVQNGKERVQALQVIASYLGQLKWDERLPHLSTIHAADHDHVCGAVKVWLGQSLPEFLTELYGKEITPQSEEEDTLMESLIRDGAFVWIAAFAGTGVEVLSHLHVTDRDNPENNHLRRIDLDSSGAKMNVQMLIHLRKLMLELRS